MRFKNDGFTLIEVMFAVTIMGLILAPLFLLENTVLDGVGRVTLQFKQWLSAQNFLYESRRSQPISATEFSVEKKEKEPPLIIKYTLTPIPTNSVFKKNRNLYVETVTASEVQKKGEKQKLVNIRFKPPKVKP